MMDMATTYMQLGQANALAASAKANPEDNAAYKAQVMEAAQEFEGVFLSQMLETMFSGIDTSPSLFGGGNAERTFRSLQIQQYGDMVASQGGIGLAQHLQTELLKMQEVQ